MLKLSGFWRNRNEEIAAIDLGSNSFHMIIARVEQGQFTIIDRLKEPVRLGFGLDEKGNLDDLSQKRALACLERFNQRIKHLPAASVRAVGTRTFRQARNARPFLKQAEHALGFDIHIVSGSEEARLVYQGVAFGVEDDHEKRLVVDIGGGSTELIIGEDYTPESLESLGMGCVSVTKRFFSKGVISENAVKQAEVYCLQKLEPVQTRFNLQSWQSVIGCSGSIKAVSKVIEALTGHPLITPDTLAMLIKQCLQLENVDHLNFSGLNSQRQPVFIGGLIVLKSVMQALKLDSLESSPWALREGVLFDLLGHDNISDMRLLSVQQLAKRFHTDVSHAHNTNLAAQQLFDQIQPDLQLDDAWRSYLNWACLLQEVGLDINHERYHVHSGYIVENSHLAGFGYDEQNRLAFLVRNQRKKPDWRQIEKLPADELKSFIAVLHIYRLACALTRARDGNTNNSWKLSMNEEEFVFSAPAIWWEKQPLASADLDAELAYLKKSPYRLKFKTTAND